MQFTCGIATIICYSAIYRPPCLSQYLFFMACATCPLPSLGYCSGCLIVYLLHAVYKLYICVYVCIYIYIHVYSICLSLYMLLICLSRVLFVSLSQVWHTGWPSTLFISSYQVPLAMPFCSLMLCTACLPRGSSVSSSHMLLACLLTALLGLVLGVRGAQLPAQWLFVPSL